jgi:Transposase DDE domain
MVARETVCLKRLSETRAEERAAGRFLDTDKVTVAGIVESWSERTGAAAQGRHVLAIQDTTEVKFPTTAAHRRGLGPIGCGTTHGVLVHAMLAVDADSLACLGLVGGSVWNRPGVVEKHHKERPLSERESRRWLETADTAREVLAPAAMITVVDDREGDLWPKWARLPAAGFHLLTRAQVDRPLAGGTGGTLFTAAAAFPLAETRAIEIRSERVPRVARLQMRFGAVEVCRPRHEKDRMLARTARLCLVEVRETEPSEGVKPLCWRLLTTHAVANVIEAWRIVGWYQARWTIEQLFRTMKSQGLGLEDSAVTSAGRLLKLSAAATKAACVTMRLVQERDGAHGLPASDVFCEPEIDTIEALSPTLEGRVERQKNPHPPRSLAQAAWVIARLGGWHCYGAPPGPITMRRGLERFHAIHLGRMLNAKPTLLVGRG